MKKVIALFLLSFILFSCAMTPEIKDWYDYDSSKVPAWAMQDIDSMIQFIYSDQYIKYKSDKDNYGKDEYTATPDETLDRMSGDCDDQAALFAAMIWKKYHKKCKIIGGHVKDTIFFHAYVFYENKKYNLNVKIDYQTEVIEFDFIDEWINENR